MITICCHPLSTAHCSGIWAATLVSAAPQLQPCKLCVWWTTVARLLCLTKHLPWKLSEETTYGPNDCLGQLREIIFQRSETDFVFSSVKDVKSKLCLIIFRYQVLSRGPSKIFLTTKLGGGGQQLACIGIACVTLLLCFTLQLWCSGVRWWRGPAVTLPAHWASTSRQHLRQLAGTAQTIPHTNILPIITFYQ